MPSPQPVPAPLILCLASTLGALAAMVCIYGFKRYGFVLFVVVPALITLGTMALYANGRTPSAGQMLRMMFGALGLTGLLLLACRVEGVICLVMAGGLGSIVTLLIWVLVLPLLRKNEAPSRQKLHGVILVLLPASLAAESWVSPSPPLLEQTTSIEINAPPEVVWRFIPAFPAIETPPGGLLAAGLACPVSANMTGSGVGAARSCVLSTGAMPEVITAWEPDKRLEFDVLRTPATMNETNPLGRVEAAHTEGYFLCKHGRFILTHLPGGGTRVEGTSWFQQDLWPQLYWAPLTREVVREVHERVLKHIKSLAESASASPP